MGASVKTTLRSTLGLCARGLLPSLLFGARPPIQAVTSPYPMVGQEPPHLDLDGGDDHHAFHKDAKPGDLTGQSGTRCFSSSKKFSTTIKSVSLSPSPPATRVVRTSGNRVR